MVISDHQITFAFFVSILILAAFFDIRHRKIPNLLTFPAVLVGLSFHVSTGGLQGLFFSLKGLGIGFVLLIPFYAGGGMGAGDVKLMAAVGAFVGTLQVLKIFLLTAVFGGVYALVLMVARGTLLMELRFVTLMLGQAVSGGGLGALRTRVNTREGMHYTVPYGLAIAVGTGLSFFWP